MNDLVKRLRSGAGCAVPVTLGGAKHDERCLEAADTIEAQAARIEQLEEALGEFVLFHDGPTAAKRPDAFERMINRARAARGGDDG